MRYSASTNDIWQAFHDANFDALWYAHPGPGRFDRLGPRWHAGVWTGPDLDLVCLKRCRTYAQADRWLSPAGDTPEDAVRLAIAELKRRNRRSR